MQRKKNENNLFLKTGFQKIAPLIEFNQNFIRKKEKDAKLKKINLLLK